MLNSQRPVPLRDTINHLVLVAGHAVLRFNEIAYADSSDGAWYLLPYQRQQGYPLIISLHVKRGIQLIKNDPNALLIFSGGQTRKDVGPFSEAISYYYLAYYKQWLRGSVTVPTATGGSTSSAAQAVDGNKKSDSITKTEEKIIERVFLEEYARDSFENLLFSICRYREITGRYPQHVTVVGFDFKANRFSSLHRKALMYPAGNFTYEGVKSPSSFNQKPAESGEAVAVSEFERDMYGCRDNALTDKRFKRDPFHRSIPYETACPELKDLLHWCGPDIIPESLVPWH